MGVPEFPQLELLGLWGHITLRADFWLQWGLKKSYSRCWEMFNGMLHATYTQGNWVDSWLLVVGSQIVSLTPNFSFDHNLCFTCPNGSCKPILDIYVSIDFQWYKKLFKPMGFDPCNHTLKNQESIWDSNSHNGSSHESVKVHSLTLFALLGACDVTPMPPFWLATLQALALVTSPRLGLQQKWNYEGNIHKRYL
jgi:hypothetical protein